MQNSAEKKLRIVRNIIAARTKARVTQGEASRRCGKSENFFTKIESLKRDVKGWELYDIATAVETTAWDLLGERPEPKTTETTDKKAKTAKKTAKKTVTKRTAKK